MTGTERFDGKNGFVFPEFYGSYHKTISPQYPQWHGESHVKEIEQQFWDVLQVTKKWQDGLVASYNECGYVETKLGFRRYGPLKKNEIINTPIQATAFHRLLLALIDSEDEMRKQHMRSEIIGQIHDDLVTDIFEDESDEIIDLQEEMMTKHVWDWDQGVPMEAEFALGENFLEMVEL